LNILDFEVLLLGGGHRLSALHSNEIKVWLEAEQKELPTSWHFKVFSIFYVRISKSNYPI
jgi:hypothetical protein